MHTMGVQPHTEGPPMIRTLALTALILTTACGTPPNETENNPNNMPPTMNPPASVDCQSRCVAKAQTCGAPADQGAALCAMDYCSGSPTEAYVSCLEGVPCAAVGDPDDFRTACGVPDPDPGPGGDTCDGFPKCSGSSVQTCTITDGTRVLETSACSANETCSNAKCEQNACIMSKKTGCNAGNNPSNCCDDRQKCSSNGNKKGETICCIPMNDACDEDADCCNSDADGDFPVRCHTARKVCTIAP